MPLGFATGFLIGAQHVVQSPDHMAAVAPLAADNGERTWVTGGFWGMGHASGVVILGGLALLFREAISDTVLAAMGVWCERAIGFMLIAVGVWGLRRIARKPTLHIHDHIHRFEAEPGEGEIEVKHAHVHEHSHTHNLLHRHSHEIGHTHKHKHHCGYAHGKSAYLVGLLHGLAGGTHLGVGVLPALLSPTRSEAIAWIVAFALGSMMAMTSFTFVMGLLSKRIGFSDRGYRWLVGTCCVGAMFVGVCWLAGWRGSHGHDHGGGGIMAVGADGSITGNAEGGHSFTHGHGLWQGAHLHAAPENETE